MKMKTERKSVMRIIEWIFGFSVGFFNKLFSHYLIRTTHHAFEVCVFGLLDQLELVKTSK